MGSYAPSTDGTISAVLGDSPSVSLIGYFSSSAVSKASSFSYVNKAKIGSSFSLFGLGTLLILSPGLGLVSLLLARA